MLVIHFGCLARFEPLWSTTWYTFIAVKVVVGVVGFRTYRVPDVDKVQCI
jgi:hypothetical protein